MKSDDSFVNSLHAWMKVFMRQSVQHMIQYSHESGLSMQQIRALFRIHDCSRGVSDLGCHLGVSKAAASQMLDRMVDQGFILRSEDPEDRRSKHIVLTEKGLLAMQRSIETRQGWLTQLAGHFSPTEKEQVSQALDILVEKASQIKSDSDQ
jgi:DNA-binding MarR family transcriptional regulator